MHYGAATAEDKRTTASATNKTYRRKPKQTIDKQKTYRIRRSVQREAVMVGDEQTKGSTTTREHWRSEA